MLRAPIVFVLLGLSAPALAQQIDPAIAGEGSQSQGVELLDDSVSVTLDTAGSGSIGHGEPTFSGSAAVSVNDTTIIGIGPGSEAQPASGSADPIQPTASTSRAAAERSGVGAASVSPPGAFDGQGGACVVALPKSSDIEAALTAGAEVILQPAACRAGDGDIQHTIAASPLLLQLLSERNVPVEAVAAITISAEMIVLSLVS